MSLTFDTIGRGWRARDMRIEYIVVRELFYNAGRIVSIILFLATVLAFKDNEEGIRYLMMVIGAGHLAIYFCIRGLRFKSAGDENLDRDEARRFRDGESGSPVWKIAKNRYPKGQDFVVK